VEERLSAAESGGFERLPPTTEEVRGLLASDDATLDLLPAFPNICQEVIEGIDAGASFAELESLMKTDGGLQASIVKTANQIRSQAKGEVDNVAIALSIIGLEETRKIAAGKAMRQLAGEIDQEGFDLGDFLRHSAAVGFLAQMLSLDPGADDGRARESRRSLGLQPFVCAALQISGLWERFELEDKFDAFTSGILHDLGKIFNVTCYRGIYSLIQYEIEQSRWRSGLLESESVVVWDFQHPGTGSALLAEWGLFPHLIWPIHHHHQIQPDSSPATVLLALANCLAKGAYPFPAAIDLSPEFRRAHLESVADEEVKYNPLSSLYQHRVDLFHLELDRLLISAQELESGEYAPEKLELMLSLARSTFENHDTYVEWLVCQNPEFPAICQWLGTAPEHLLGLSLLLRKPLLDLVGGPSARLIRQPITWKCGSRRGKSIPFRAISTSLLSGRS
jgi:HD-like signal output (HDOD) protein